MGHVEEHIGRIKERLAIVRLVHKLKGVVECVDGDDVAGTGFKDVVHLQDFARLSGYLHPREQFFQVLGDNGLESTNTGDREKGVEGISTSAVQVVVWCRHNGVGG